MGEKLDGGLVVQGTVIVPVGVMEEVVKGGRRHLCCQLNKSLSVGEALMVHERDNEEMELLVLVQCIDRAPEFGLPEGVMAISFVPLGLHVTGERGEQLKQAIHKKSLASALSTMGSPRGKA